MRPSCSGRHCRTWRRHQGKSSRVVDLAFTRSVLRDASGLKPTSQGWRIRYEGGRRSIVDGPFAETKELIAGYTIIQGNSKEEAIDWTKRFPNPVGEGRDAEIEVRQFFELDDFTPGEAVERFREMGIGEKV